MVISSQQDASYAFSALATIFCCFLSMALIFVPKVIEVIRHPRDKSESRYNPDGAVSKEEEEKYQKLLNENDELQKLIAAVRMLRASMLQFLFYIVSCVITSLLFIIPFPCAEGRENSIHQTEAG